MDESRLKAYFKLIQSLLDCKSGEELTLLQNNQALIDIDFIQVVEQVAAQAQVEGKQGATDFLQTLVKQLKETYAITESTDNFRDQDDTVQPYYSLIEALLSCPNGQEGKILSDNLHLFDLRLLETMKQVAKSFSEEGEEGISHWLINLASQIKIVVATCLFDKGNQDYQHNNFEAAKQSWQEALALYQEIGDRNREADLLGSLGIAHYFMGQYEIAINYCQHSLRIQKEICDRAGESDSLINIGNVFYSSGKYA